MADTLGADRVVPLLHGRFGSRYVYAESCESTQQLLAVDLPEGAVAVSEYQAAGRGRLGRGWKAPPGTSILCSILLRPPPNRNAAQLSLVAGLATARAVERTLDGTVEIKWPNDVLVDGKKTAGVLAEARGPVVMLGIGLNVNQRADELPGDARLPAASLFVVDGVRRERAPILADLLGELELLYSNWVESGLETCLEELQARDALRGRRVSVGGATGTVVGMTSEGLLELEADGELLLVGSGEVTYEP
jgi:BirA family transcriptional regulator, biotin operon repressor / biotin---[acetyl-CoA-carboxylase] ligase